MDITTASWSDFKSVVASKPLLMQYYDCGNYYQLWAVDHIIVFNYVIWKSGSEPLGSDVTQITSDRTDFETNYKSTCNTRVGIKVEPFADPIVAFASEGTYGVATAGGTTNLDYKITVTKSIYGAQYFAQNSVAGDSVLFQIVDVDGIMGHGPGLVLSSFVNKWYVIPNTFVDVPLPLSSQIPEGLYIRVVYNSTGSQNVNMICNYYLTVSLM